VTGQGMIGRDCAWCDRPAVCEVEVQPAAHRTISKRDLVTGERTAHRHLVQAPIRVPACDEHRTVTTGQPPPVTPPRQRRARDVQQLGLFVSPLGERLRSAIDRDSGR